MPIVVVGGSARNVGKTSLICGILAGLPEYPWIAVKVTSDNHGASQPLWEEHHPGPATDTARYRAAGARRAFLITAAETEWPALLRDLNERVEEPASFLFESNRIVNLLRPDVHLAVRGPDEKDPKPSFRKVAHQTDAAVVQNHQDGLVQGPQPLFKLADLTRISPQLRQWLRDRLTPSHGPTE